MKPRPCLSRKPTKVLPLDSPRLVCDLVHPPRHLLRLRHIAKRRDVCGSYALIEKRVAHEIHELVEFALYVVGCDGVAVEDGAED
jgi:hypothetical protein